jgi:hypothetical protein
MHFADPAEKGRGKRTRRLGEELKRATAEAAKYDAFGPNHGGAFRPFDCGRAVY